MSVLPLIFISLLHNGAWLVGSDERPTGDPSANATTPSPQLNDSSFDGVNKTQLSHEDALNQTGRPETGGFLSGHFGFDGLAGIRSFNTEMEKETENRIIGGKEAWAHSWPWQVSLCFASMPVCGGAIITPFHKKPSYWTVLAGKHDLDNPHEPAQQLVEVARIINHHAYNTRTKEGDLALLMLQTPLIFNQFIKPIDIWMGQLEPQRNCTITGWGSTCENGPRVNRLQEVNVTCLPFNTCNNFYRGRIKQTMFCAGDLEGGVDACQGDSGGPLSCFTGIRYELAGLVSWGIGCGRARRPGVYTKVQDHIGWISDVLTKGQQMSSDFGDNEGESCGQATTPPWRLGSVAAGLVVSHGRKVEVRGMIEACPNSWPWQVSLQSQGRHYCSGTLIHKRWVLTARHCHAKVGDTVELAVHNLRFKSPQSIPVAEVFSLPQDSGFPPTTDLSLLRLAGPAKLDASVSVVCVPDEDEEVDESWTCVTTGWGATAATVGVSPKALHQARLTLLNQTLCRQSWRDDLSRDSHLCSHPAGSVSCLGDSGAPLLCQKHGVYYLFGVVTWGNKNCNLNKPAVFSKTSEFRPWITEITHEI